MTDVVIRRKRLGDLNAVVRTWAGVFDCQRADDRWTCSCGAGSICTHAAAVELAMVSTK